MQSSAKPEFHLCPAFVLHGAESGMLTPFNLVPNVMATQSLRLLRLCAVPLYRLRFFGPRYNDHGLTYPLDLIYVEGTRIIGPWDRVTARPALLWSDEPNALDVAHALLDKGAIFLVHVTNDPDVIEQLRKHPQLSERVSAVLAADPGADIQAPDLATRIWTAYLELLEAAFAAAGVTFPGLGSGWPTHKDISSVAELLQLAKVHALSPAAEAIIDEPISGDLVLAPNRVLLSIGQNRLPRFERGQPVSEPTLQSVKLARTIMALRGLSLLAQLRLRAEYDPPTLAQLASVVAGDEAREALDALDAFDRGALDTVTFMRVLAQPADALARFAPHQVILVCPAASHVPTAKPGSTASALGFKLIGRYGDTALDELVLREPAYFSHVVDQILLGGRRVGVEQPTNEDQQRIVQIWLHGLLAESEYLSAVALAYAERFSCPVLKSERAGRDVRDRLLAVNSIFDEMETEEGQLLTSAADAARVANALRDLSTHTTPLIASEYLYYVAERPNPMVHGFSDYPLEFVQCGEDWLGYAAEVSRTPITPGDLAVLNYSQTELTTRLPTSADEFLLVTPFQQTEIIDAALSGLKHVPAVRTQVVHRVSDMIDRLDDERIGCLVFFGHGYYDPDRDESALVLNDQYFYAADVRQARRVPPLVVLIGCNTAAASSMIRALHTELFRAGAQLIVGTSFPVPVVTGAQFLGLFISNLLSPAVSLEGGLSRAYRDLSEVVAIVRRRMRPMSDLFSLLEQRRITEERHQQAVEMFIERLAKLDLNQMARDEVQLEILRELLAELGVIADKSESPLNWGVVPYPLFFSVLGFPWTNRSDRWLKTSQTS